MLRPAPLAKVTITSSKRYLRPIVEQLYKLQSVHLVSFSEGRQPEFADFRIGKSLPEGPKASEHLVRLRGLARHLDLGEHEPATRISGRDIEHNLGDRLSQLELNITSAAETRGRIQASIDGLEKERSLLGPFLGLPLRLEDYGGYQSLAVLVGRAETSVEDAVRKAVPEAEVFVAPTNHFAVFVPKDRQGKAAEAVASVQGSMGEVPKGQGSVQDRLDAIGRELQQLQARLAAAEEELTRLRREHADFLVAAEEHLTIQAEKADAPLRFASTEHAFVAECWVAEDEAQGVYSTLRAAVGDNFHYEVERPGHGHAAHAKEAHQAPGEEPEAHAGEEHEADIPPTKFRLARPFRPFQMFTEMVSVPRHDEIDPTPILALVLPLFLGFMIGDAGYGVLMLALGVWLIRSLGPKIPDLRDIGLALAVSGALAFLFGAFVFSDAFGIPLGMHEEGVSCAGFMAAHGETTWGCILGQPAVIQPVIAKLRDISDLLMISVLAASVHMSLGLGFGIANAWRHSKKHVLAKLGWFVLMVGFLAQILYMAGPVFGPGEGNRIANAAYAGLGIPTLLIEGILPGVTLHMFLVGGMVLAAVFLAIGEGAITVLELPTMLSNLMSYTRLAGLAIAKGAMAAAFTSLTLVAMVYEGGSFILVVIGLVLFIITQLFVFVLGVFSSAIQAIRLNYVEFFNKFYTGGGVPFVPFGKKRKHTVEGSP